MRVDVRGHGVEVSEELREHVARRLQFALDRFRERVETAHVSLRDLNGSGRGGVDKECRIELVLGRSGSLAAHARRTDLHQAVDAAAGAAGRSLARELERRRMFARPGPQSPFPPLPPPVPGRSTP